MRGIGDHLHELGLRKDRPEQAALHPTALWGSAEEDRRRTVSDTTRLLMASAPRTLQFGATVRRMLMNGWAG